MRFTVTHHLPGHEAPVSTLTDAAGVGALLAQAEATGGRLHIRPHPRETVPAVTPTTPPEQENPLT